VSTNKSLKKTKGVSFRSQVLSNNITNLANNPNATIVTQSSGGGKGGNQKRRDREQKQQNIQQE